MSVQKLCYAVVMIFAGCVTFATVSLAADNAPPATSTSPEKLKLIKEVLVESRTTRNARVGFDLVFGQEIKGMTAAQSDRIDRDPMLTVAQKAERKRIMSESLQRRSKRFSDLITEKVNLDQAIDEVFVPLFDKHFTEAELNAMLVYFKSPVGQKSLDLLPQMSMEAAMTLSVRLMPKLKEISAQVEAEERAAAEAALQNAAKQTEAPKK